MCVAGLRGSSRSEAGRSRPRPRCLALAMASRGLTTVRETPRAPRAPPAAGSPGRAPVLSWPPPIFLPLALGLGDSGVAARDPAPRGQAPTALSAVADGRAWRRFSVLSGELGLRVWPAPMVPLVSPGGRCPPRAWEERGLCEPGAHCQLLLPSTGAGSDPPGLPRSAVQLCLRGPPCGRGRRRERRC